MKPNRRHYEASLTIPGSAERVFAYIDDHKRFSSHMSQSSWMMAGGRMKLTLDAGGGKKLGSHIKLGGKVLGASLYLDEVITEYQPPLKKVWETVGATKLLVIGDYRLGVEIKPKDQDCLVRVFIDYELPATNVWLGRLFGGIYAKWCVGQMIQGIHYHFSERRLD